MGRQMLGVQGFRQAIVSRLSSRLRSHVALCHDLRGLTTDPLEAVYLNPESPFLIDIASHQCRGLHSMAYPMDPDSAHPFILTLRAIEAGLRGYAGSPLQTHYAAFQPDTAARAVGLDPSDTHPDLHLAPAATTLPWDFRSPEQAQKFWTSVSASDYRQHGFALGFSDGWKAWGPVSTLAGQAEFTRLRNAYTSIKTRGYRRHAAGDGDIEGIILRKGTETRILLTAGQHRAAVLAALGQSSLPVRLTSAIMDRDDVLLWANVQRGIYTVAQALSVFDRIFAGRQPFQRAAPLLRTVQ